MLYLTILYIYKAIENRWRMNGHGNVHWCHNIGRWNSTWSEKNVWKPVQLSSAARLQANVFVSEILFVLLPDEGSHNRY